jgi:hypothetical protein
MNRNYLAPAIGLLVACAVGTAAAQASGPPAGYEIKPEHTVTSPDGTTIVEQYAKVAADGDYTWQFWARRDAWSNSLGARLALPLRPAQGQVRRAGELCAEQCEGHRSRLGPAQVNDTSGR